ncbi:MAG: hypothetical protein DMG07_02440 [Acidobacteria bacterium]|nr:MAG: hypothetical protein DMG07_02440 [Acidobacteriota bacterium]
MTDLEQAVELLGVDAKFLQPFDTTDPFADEVRLEGFLCQRPDHRYGALALLRVDGRPAPQRIFATPKVHYPFGKDGRFFFPPIQSAHLYEKLDGTNVLAYRYRDADDRWRLTYKLRLAPTLRNSKWGPFLDYWRELLARHPEVPALIEANGCHVSFEMYGARNAHLIVYETPLALAVLFGVRPADGTVVAPFQLRVDDAPVAPLVGELRAGEDPVARFQALREEMERRNKPTSDDKLSGTEGAVWYVTEPSGRVTMWKCKPESVEDIHWATGINKVAVVATCWNALETSDVLSYDVLLPLLLEEYQLDDVEKFRTNIDDAIRQVNVEQEFRRKVRTAYEAVKTQGLSLTRDKTAVMRALSGQFRRDQMGHVYAAIVRLGE